MANLDTTMTKLEEKVLAPHSTANAAELFAPRPHRPTESDDSTTDALPPPPPVLIVNEAHDREQERFRLRRESFISRLIFGG